MKILLFGLAALLAAPAARAASTGTATAQEYSWIDGYAARAKAQLRDLDTQLEASRRDAQRLSDEARDTAHQRISQLDRQVRQSQKELERLRRTGEMKAVKARKRLETTIEDLRREYEGLRKDLQEQEKDEQKK